MPFTYWFAAKVLAIGILTVNLGYIALMEILYRVRRWRTTRRIGREFHAPEWRRTR